jgi:hypothetical protein
MQLSSDLSAFFDKTFWIPLLTLAALGVWKLVEIIIWVFSHIHWTN